MLMKILPIPGPFFGPAVTSCRTNSPGRPLPNLTVNWENIDSLEVSFEIVSYQVSKASGCKCLCLQGTTVLNSRTSHPRPWRRQACLWNQFGLPEYIKCVVSSLFFYFLGKLSKLPWKQWVVKRSWRNKNESSRIRSARLKSFLSCSDLVQSGVAWSSLI